MTTVAERLAAVLGAHATEVFGLLGNGNAHLVDAMLRLTPIRYTAVRHEAATVASADAHYRATRRLAIATATYGAGFTNTLTALTEAAMSHTPLVLVVGDEPSSGRRPWDVDQIAIAAACGAPTIVVDAERPGAQALEAVRRAHAERGPIVLALPYDLPMAPTAEPEPALELDAPEFERAATAELEALADRLVAARRPIVLAGCGAFEACSDLTAIADALGAITVATAPARGYFAGRELDAGVCGGFSSERTAGYLGEADLVLAVGAGLNQFTIGFGRLFDQAHLAQLDLEAPTAPQVGTAVRGDAGPAVRELRALVEARLADAAPDERWPGVDPAEVAGAQLDRGEAPEHAPDGRLDPRGLMTALDAKLPARRLVCSDGGHFIGWANTHLRLDDTDTMVLVGTKYQSIGLGFASAPGAAIAAAEAGRMLVVPTGDGGGLMALADLDSIVRTAHRATIIVFNDAAYTAETTQYGTQGLDERPMRIDEVDFAQLALGVGARSTVVRDLADLDEWAAWAAGDEPGTWLLDCRISGEVIAPYQLEIMENLRRAAAQQAQGS